MKPGVAAVDQAPQDGGSGKSHNRGTWRITAVVILWGIAIARLITGNWRFRQAQIQELAPDSTTGCIL